VDANYYKPMDMIRDPIKEYEESHIPGAVFFYIDGVCDKSSKFPHMIPSVEDFIGHMKRLGV
jgi:thiosulfate/3-mercaptopyruvate sulfurtransferase